MDAVKQNLVSTLHIDENGNKNYYLPDGKTFHREDGPAIEYASGDKVWYINGKVHREDGPAMEDSDGVKVWWINGKIHRVNGPAVENRNGDKSWYLNGKLHRVDGPAVEEVNGYKEWWLNGIKYPFEEWDRLRNLLWIL